MAGPDDEILNRYHRRAMTLARAVEPGGTQEVSIPESSRRIDMLTVVGQPSEAWGLLREDLAHRVVVLEHYSQAPSAADLAKCLLELAWSLEQWLRGKWEGTKRPPLGLVMSVGTPTGALDHFQHLVPGEPEGLYRSRDPGLELILVDVRSLPVGPGTAFLRMFDHRREVVEANLHTLREDPGVGKLTKDAIGAAIMNEPMVFDPTERRMTWDEAVAHGARSTLTLLLERAFGPLSPAVVARLQSASLVQLREWTVAFADARSLEDVFPS